MKQYYNNNLRDILESVHSIVSDTKYIKNEKRYWKKIDMAQNRETEKIIIEAEKALSKNNKKNNIKTKIDNLELAKSNDKKLNTSSNETLILENEKKDNDNGMNKDFTTNNILVLDNEYKEDNNTNIINKNILKEEVNLDELEEENEIQELENNYLYINEKLKSSNTKQEEKIKDLNILLDKFTSKERYINLDEKIKLYQDDNAALREKIFKLSEVETNLRLELSDLNQNTNKTFEEDIKTEKEEIKKLNIQIENLSQKNNQLQSEISSIKEDKKYQTSDIAQKINFYREEYAKIIVDKSDIQKKLEISKNQMQVNEKNKIELKIALENLNQILSSSNIETKVFNNENEKFLNKPRKEK